jgi:predicted NAD/FAD-binding protein
VETVASDMSFSVRLDQPDLEWASTSIDSVFGQRSNLARPAFWFDGPEDCRCAARRRRRENELDINLGFRVLREP